MAVTETISVYRGEQVTLTFQMTPVENVTGWTIHFTVAKKANAASKLIGPLLATTSGLASGQFRVQLTEEVLDKTPGTYFFDAWRTDEGQEQVLALGPFIIGGNARVPPTEVV
jgi:hypothetical protein